MTWHRLLCPTLPWQRRSNGLTKDNSSLVNTAWSLQGKMTIIYKSKNWDSFRQMLWMMAAWDKIHFNKTNIGQRQFALTAFESQIIPPLFSPFHPLLPPSSPFQTTVMPYCILFPKLKTIFHDKLASNVARMDITSSSSPSGARVSFEATVKLMHWHICRGNLITHKHV